MRVGKRSVDEIIVKVQVWGRPYVKRRRALFHHLLNLLPKVPLPTPDRIDRDDIPSTLKCTQGIMMKGFRKRIKGILRVK